MQISSPFLFKSFKSFKSLFSSKQPLGILRSFSKISLPKDSKFGINVGGSGFGTKEADMGIVFTCTKCDTRSTKFFSKKSYEQGLVIVQCPGCKNLHLIADNYGWFKDGEGKNIEEFLKERGEFVKRISQDTEISPEDLAGSDWDFAQMKRVAKMPNETESVKIGE